MQNHPPARPSTGRAGSSSSPNELQDDGIDALRSDYNPPDEVTDAENDSNQIFTMQTEEKQGNPLIKKAGRTTSSPTKTKRGTSRKTAAKEATTPKNHGDTKEGARSRSAKASKVDELLAAADSLHNQMAQSERELLAKRLELGVILLKLKEEVGHGNFMKEFVKWSDAKKVSFGLKTAQRSMAYAKLKEEGKFDSVSNLTEAERLRCAEVAEKKAEKKAEKQKNKPTGMESQTACSLKKPQINGRALQLAKPLLDECAEYELESKRALLEEVIELLTVELEQWN
jgi:hypothetical protein